MQTPESHNQAVEDSRTTSRIHSDSALLMGGAVIHNGQLHPTASQKEAIRRDMTEERVGQVVLHDTFELSASRTSEDVIAAEDHRALFMESLQELSDTYVALFDNKVPVTSKRDRTLTGKLKPSVDLKPWSTTREYDEDIAAFDFGGKYTPGQRSNSLSEVTLAVQNIDEIDESYPGIAMKLTVTDGAITNILTRFNARHAFPRDDPIPAEVSTGALVEFMQRTVMAYMVRGSGESFGGMSFSNSMWGGETSVTFDQNEISLRGARNGGDKGFTYLYQPGQDTLRQVQKDCDSCPVEITKEQFLGVVTDLLGIIPTMPAVQEHSAPAIAARK